MTFRRKLLKTKRLSNRLDSRERNRQIKANNLIAAIKSTIKITENSGKKPPKEVVSFLGKIKEDSHLLKIIIKLVEKK